MVNGSLDSSHVDESNGFWIIKIGLILAEIFQFEISIAFALKLRDMSRDRELSLLIGCQNQVGKIIIFHF